MWAMTCMVSRALCIGGPTVREKLTSALGNLGMPENDASRRMPLRKALPATVLFGCSKPVYM